jgi:very-short-patch-repair endonuclease
MTDAETLLWSKLRSRQLNGVKFKWQVPIGRYVADFASLEHHVVVEVDGSQHLEPDALARDAERTRVLEAMGYVVLRFLNTDVLTNIDGVAGSILSVINNLGPVPLHPSPLPSGERGRVVTPADEPPRPGGERVGVRGDKSGLEGRIS